MKNKAFRNSVYLIILAAILLALVLNINDMVNFFSWIYNAFSALIIGGCIAFVLNILVDFLEERVFARIYNEKLQITLSLIISIIIILAIILILVLIIVPQLIETFKVMSQKIPTVLNGLQDFAVSITNRFPEISEKLSEVKASSTHLGSSILNYLKNDLPRTLDQTYLIASKTFKSVMTFFIGFMIAIYIILSKGRLGNQAREFCYGAFSKKAAQRVLYIAHLASKDFKAFILGRVLDAMLMAVAYLIIAWILRLPYTLMIASIIAVFSIIPLFGAIISWAVGFILIITVSFWKAVIFSVVILSILFITRNFIYPKLIGDSIGLPDLWVLVAVVIGGKLFGLLGMITAVPVFSVLYHLVSIFIHTQIEKKKVPESEIVEPPNWKEYDDLTNTFDKK